MAERICPQCGLETAAALCPQHQCPTVARPSGTLSQLQAGTVIDQRYRIEGQLGKGGFGAVFLASHVATRQQVVIKVLKPDLTEDPTQVQRFYNEARASSLLSHPHTVRVHDFGQTDSGLLFIAMERLHGRELAQALKDAPGGRIAPLRLARIALAVCKSLSEAHHAGLVHRDLKPDNVFLCDVHGEDEFVKVIDFGIAKPVDAPVDGGLTRTGFTVGTPKYMSPEQVMQRPLDGRSDLYSLGIVMYQCLCGEVPFSGATPMETLMAHLQQQATPLSQRLPGLAPSLVAVVEKAMAKQPADRFADADAMRAALAGVLVDLQDSSSPPTQTGRRPAVVIAEPAAPAPAPAAAPATAAAAAPPGATATTQPAPHKRRPPAPEAKAAAATADATAPHAEVYAVNAAPGHRAAPAAATSPALAAPPPAAAIAGPEPEITLYAQAIGDDLDLPTYRPVPRPTDAETALLEHPTLRDDYQPQTLSLPTQKLAEADLQVDADAAAAPGPPSVAAIAPTPSRRKAALGAAAATLLLAAAAWWWLTPAAPGSAAPLAAAAPPAMAPAQAAAQAPRPEPALQRAQPAAQAAEAATAATAAAPPVAAQPVAAPPVAAQPVAAQPSGAAPPAAAQPSGAAPSAAAPSVGSPAAAPPPAPAAASEAAASTQPAAAQVEAVRRTDPRPARKAAGRSRPGSSVDGDKAL